jgi:ribosomal protein S18 acetylase RimI-like enzyme
VLADAPYGEPMLASLESALTRSTDEYQAIVVADASVLVGLIVFGETAGARGAGRIHLVAVDAKARRRGIAMDLINAACARFGEQGARFVMIELPVDPRLASVRRLAERAGFHEGGRIDDYVRDGVALVLLRRDLRAAGL